MINNTISFSLMFVIITAFLATNSMRKEILSRIYNELKETYNLLRTCELSDANTHKIVELFQQERKVMKNSDIFLILIVIQLFITAGIGISDKIFTTPELYNIAIVIFTILTYFNFLRFIFAVFVFFRNPRLLICNQSSYWL